MDLKKRVYSLMIVSSNESFTKSFKQLLSPAEFSPVVTAGGINEAKRMLNQRSFDFVVINSPLSAESGVRFCCNLSTTGNTVVLLFTRAEDFAESYEEVTRFGVFTIIKPFSQQSVLTALLWLVAARERLRQYEKKEITLEEKMKEIRLVNRAKWLLIEKQKFTEEQAHKYIEKQAMDRCVAKAAVADEIIRKYS
ncbi:MAG: ANTAR domain-containing protein [Clostridia bacterium]|nr:ANTAR domain-containing protein [Clostridia bacterium]